MPVYQVNFRKHRGRKKKRLSKKEAQRIHCTRRADERFDIRYNAKVRRETIKNIQQGLGTFVGRSSNRVTIWDNVVPDNPLARVVYDKKRHEIVTMLDQGRSLGE